MQLPLATSYQDCLKEVPPMLPPSRPYWAPISGVTFTTAQYYLRGAPLDKPLSWRRLLEACEAQLYPANKREDARVQGVLAVFRQGGRTASAMQKEQMKDVSD